jgi:hypothetical protein
MACDGFAPGVSGGPFLRNFDGRRGDVIGVIGGYKTGGFCPTEPAELTDCPIDQCGDVREAPDVISPPRCQRVGWSSGRSIPVTDPATHLPPSCATLDIPLSGRSG